MKKYLSTIITASAILIVGGVILLPQIAQAQLIDFIAPSVFNNVVSWLGNRLLTLTSWAVTIGGLFLSISMNITLHIKELYQAIPAIESTWITIRDLSSIFIIFMLLYSAIIMILGVKGPAFGKLVLNIFIAGILINFSLFFVRVAVDASNLVSLQFYNAIAPKAAQGWTIENAYYDGGLSNIFMQSLKIPKIYNNKGWLKDADTTGAIVLATFGGAILMITAAFSFFAAAIAFTIRTGLLIFIMALSPLFFVGIIFPQIQAQVSSKLLGILKNQLIFMPVYLGLMYVALRFISDEGFLKIFNTSALNPELSSVTGFTMAGIVIQYTIAALFINAPLLAAISFGAWGAKWAPDASDVGKWFRKKAESTASRATSATVGRVASRVARSERFQTFAGNSLLGEMALKRTRSIAQNYDTKLNERTTQRENFARSLNRQGATAYAERLSGSIPAQTSVMGTVGRADRVGAARILNTRLAEVTADLNRLTGEFNQINAAATTAGGIANLPLWQRQRLDRLSGTNVYGGNAAAVNEITEAQNDLNSIRTQINNFQTRTGQTVRDTTRRNY